MNTAIENTIAYLDANGLCPTNTKTLYAVGRQHGMTCSQVHAAFIKDELRVGRGQYDVRLLGVSVPEVAPSDPNAAPAPVVAPKSVAALRAATIVNIQKTFADVEEVYIPKNDPTFVAWGEYKMVKTVIDSKLFFPIYISGLSGNGKTMMVEQACAKAKREFVRVQISPETDETDLIGGFRLVDGETVFYKGPVVKAMERGAVLLIDEIDRGSNKIMCLQGVLEGKPVLIKKIGQVIIPAPGFNVIATANTKGRGSEDGRFSAANIIDEAFIERFVATIDQPYPSNAVEKAIVLKHMDLFGVSDLEFADKLVAWSQIIRKTFESDGVEEVVSTRRLCHIVKAHSIFKDRAKSIAMCIARFDEDTRAAFSDLYSKIDAQAIDDQPDQHDQPDEKALDVKFGDVPF
jgi:MoxR-like ATPase